MYADFTGEELLNYLSALKVIPNNQPGMHFTGLEFVEGSLIYSSTGAPINPTETYKVAMNNYMALGGDGAPKISDKYSYIDAGLIDYIAIQDYLTAKKTISPSMYSTKNK